ncbi:Motile Sperm domain containing protein [Trichuris trichiura]|uniref:Major sperm protein n=1 Tax=Trichuris trichiura TaxID=36087 RepID=A0A077Z4C1_TRITR|nr:Motile Sperm domain containing protein [Trichuris trichiura]
MGELIHVRCEPEVLTFYAPYDHRQTTIVTLINDGKKRVAIKIRTTDNILFKVNMVYAFLDAGSSKQLHVRCLPFQFDPSKPMNHRVVVVYTEAEDVFLTSQQIWKEAVEVKEVMMKVRFTMPAEPIVTPPAIPPIDVPPSAAPPTGGVAADPPKALSAEHDTPLPSSSDQAVVAQPVQGDIPPTGPQAEEKNAAPVAAAEATKESPASNGNVPPSKNENPPDTRAPEDGKPPLLQ